MSRRPCPTCLGEGTIDDGPGVWSREAIAIYNTTNGTLSPGRILRILKPLVHRDGWPVVKPRWTFYCEIGRMITPQGDWRHTPAPVTSLTPERFRDTYDTWDPDAPA